MSRYLCRAIASGAIIGIALLALVLRTMDDDGSTAPYGQATVWSNESGQVISAARSCIELRRGGPSCLVESMSLAGASAEAIAFYKERGFVLTGFKALGRNDVGRVLDPFTNVGAMWVVLNGPSGVLVVDSLLARLELNSEADETYNSLLLARMKARPASVAPTSQALTIWHGDNLFESYEGGRGNGSRFVFQAGLHDLCHACGIGVAARVAVQFDARGLFQDASLLGFCQGPLVTREIQGRVISFHQFAGLSLGAEVSEPYLVQLPGLEICPPTTEVN